jgi:hypothetical protein
MELIVCVAMVRMFGCFGICPGKPLLSEENTPHSLDQHMTNLSLGPDFAFITISKNRIKQPNK